MGKYDKFLVGLSSAPAQGVQSSVPVNTGKYDQFLTGLDSQPQAQDEEPKTGELSIMDAMGLAGELAPSPVQRIQRGLDVAGEKIAEFGGRMGAPKTSAAVGTAVQMAPTALGAATTLGGLYSKEPTKLADAIRNTPKMLRPRYEAIKGDFVSGDLPERAGRVARFPSFSGKLQLGPEPLTPMAAPKSYPKELNSFLNFARARVNAFGKRLSPQELDDYHTELQTILSNNQLRGTSPYAIAEGVKKLVDPLRSEAIPGLGELDKVYALSKKLRVAPEVAKKIWSYVGPKMRWGAIGVP